MADYFPASLEIIVISFIGLIFGSFATAIAYREAHGEKWLAIKAGEDVQVWSKCSSCEHRLGFFDLIPLLSWVFSKGRCRHCSAVISQRYPIIELMSLLGCLGLYAVYGFNISLVYLLVMMPFLIALFWVDIDCMILPNRLIVFFAGFAIFYVVYKYHQTEDMDELVDHILGGIAYPAIFGLAAWIITKILKKSALGMGDIKFLAPAGLLAGFGTLSAFLILSGVLGVLTAFLMRKFKDSSLFPFGPALIL
ncbi:MAG: prepilin peptidase, partial [Pseudomonadota bacterium]